MARIAPASDRWVASGDAVSIGRRVGGVQLPLIGGVGNDGAADAFCTSSAGAVVLRNRAKIRSRTICSILLQRAFFFMSL